MVAELDPHSAYLSPEELRWFEEDVRGDYGGIGVEVVADGDEWRIAAVMSDSPAERGGLRSGRRIRRVDGLVPGKTPRARLLRSLRGPIGGKVTLVVSGPDHDEEITLERARVVATSVVPGEPLVDAEGLATLRIRQFQDATLAAFLEVERALLANPRLRGIVLDLRGNPGGLVESARAIADRWLENGPIHTLELRGEPARVATATPGAPLGPVPVVVLVDGATASAAELLAAALRERLAVPLLGERTFGKATVQILELLRGGGALDVTVGEYRTACGATIQASGLFPDVALEGANEARHVEREEDLPRVLRSGGRRPRPVVPRIDPLVSIVRPFPGSGPDAALDRARKELLGLIVAGQTPKPRECLP